jgi:outer membrane protein assembly factor BamB/outer membrane protein assembly factor BamD (BamD/ComL family)
MPNSPMNKAGSCLGKFRPLASVLLALALAGAAAGGEKAPEPPKPPAEYTGMPLPLTSVRHWLLCGPFDGERDKDHLGGEDKAAPNVGDKAGETSWKAWTCREDMLDFATLHGKKAGATYAFIHVRATSQRDVVLAAGSDDGLKVWFNGRQVIDKKGPRALKADEDQVALRLNQGWNRILFKVDNVGETWGLTARLAVRDRKGELQNAGDLYYALSLKDTDDNGAPKAPTLDQIYAGYRPPFVDWNAVANGWKLPLSLQPYFFNMAYVNHDTRVDAIIKRGMDLEERKEWREAAQLYQTIVDKFVDDMWLLAEQGIFVPSARYAQMRLLAFPQRELAYYRTLKDAEAEQLFRRAQRHNSLQDFAEVAERYLATTWGSEALFVLGNSALDEGTYELARYYFEQIRDYHRQTNIDPLDLLLRLADCHRHLGDEAGYAAVKAEILKLKEAGAEKARKYLANLDAWKKPEAKPFEQRRSPDYVSLNDYAPMPRPETQLSSKRFVWKIPLPRSQRDLVSYILPTVAGNRVIYRYKNTVACRSLLNGEEKWNYAPTGFLDWFDRFLQARCGTGTMMFYPDQDVLVHDGLVFTSIVKSGPSLVALDMLTGQLQWAAGPMVAMQEQDARIRYLCAPTAGLNCVYAPYVYDEIAGEAHISSEVGMTCFDSRTGKILWKNQLARLTPRKLTISRIERKIRLYSSPPTISGGVIYHCTNAGVFTALDAASGQVRWTTRYPHGELLHDMEEPQAHLWANRAPIVKDGRVYITPVDSTLCYCLDAITGKVLWAAGIGSQDIIRSLVGVSSDGNLVLQGVMLMHLVDAKTGKELWSYRAVAKHKADPSNIWPNTRPAYSRCDSRPVITEDDWVLCSGGPDWNSDTYCQMTISVREKKSVAERWFFGANYLVGEFRGQKRETLTNSEEFFNPVNRMTLKRYGATFEIECAPQYLAVNYDMDKVTKAVTAEQTPTALYAQGELHLAAGRYKQSIETMERARLGLALEEAPFRGEINQQLFQQYQNQAKAARQTNDLAAFEKYVNLMSTASTSSQDEIKVLLGMAEVFELQKRHEQSARCLAAAIRHYGPVRYGISSLLLGEQEALKAKGHAMMANLLANGPKRYYDEEFSVALRGMETSLENYFSVIAPIEPDMNVETGQFAAGRLKRLLKQAPADQVERFNQEAAKAFAGHKDGESLARLINEYPATKTAQEAFDGLIAEARKLAEPDRRIKLWFLADLAAVNGLAAPADLADLCYIKAVETPPAALAASYEIVSQELEADANTSLCMLKRRGERKGAENLLFVGVCSKRDRGSKYSLICWDAAANTKLWQVPELRLKAEGHETGFEEYFVHDNRVVTHGRSDVLSFDLAKGELAWRFQAPFGFEILQAASIEDLIILCGHDRTLAVHHKSGRIVWESAEKGAPYCEPVLRDNVVAMVRVNPSGVTFRSLGTGRLLAHQELSELLDNREHPVLKRVAQATPVSRDKNLALVSDGWDYILVDADLKKVKWQRRIEDVDRTSPLPLPYRFTVTGTEIISLKLSYDNAAMEGIDAETGAALWAFKEPGTPLPYGNVFDAKNIYGAHLEPSLKCVSLLGLDRRTGKGVFKFQKSGYENPEVLLDEEMHGRHLLTLVRDKQNYELLLVNVDTGKVDAELKSIGFGPFGVYGGVSYAAQDKYVALLSGSKLIVARPK